MIFEAYISELRTVRIYSTSKLSKTLQTFCLSILNLWSKDTIEYNFLLGNSITEQKS